MQKEWEGWNAPSNMVSFEQNLVTIHTSKLLKPHTMRVTLKTPPTEDDGKQHTLLSGFVLL